LARGQRLAIDADLVLLGGVEGGEEKHLAVDGDAAVLDPHLRIAARAEAGAGDDFGKPVAGKGRSSIGHVQLLRDRRATWPWVSASMSNGSARGIARR